MRFLRKLFRPPSPVDLGMAKYEALPMRAFDPFCEDICWEDWEEEVRRDYPVRYFLGETVPHWFAVKIEMPLSNFKWWVIDLFRRPHMLDCRNREYKGGYLDPRRQMLYAGVACLARHLTYANNYRDNYTEEEIDEQHLREWQNHYDECQALWNYWAIIRPTLEKEHHQYYLDMKEAGELGDKEEYTRLRKLWVQSREEEERLEEDFMERLVKVRVGLWS